MLIINPSSEHKGGSFEIALDRAKHWAICIANDGIEGVQLLDGAETCECGWAFTFRHDVTGVECRYETHGLFGPKISPYDAGYVFAPRDYWNGSSTAGPKAEDFLRAGFRVVHKIEIAS